MNAFSLLSLCCLSLSFGSVAKDLSSLFTPMLAENVVVYDTIEEDKVDEPCETVVVETKPSFAPLKKQTLLATFGDSEFELRGKLREDVMTALINGTLLNFYNEADRLVVPGKHTFDLSFIYHYGRISHGYDVAKVVGTLRNRYVFGDPEANGATARTTIKELGAVIGDHSHPLTLLLPIVRELWIELTLNNLFGFDSNHRHTFTTGVFPFQLGRGIALGDAYAVTPDFLGYNPANAVQQYAPGFKFSGFLMDDEELGYDVYVEIADNRGDTADNTFANIRGQQYGHRFDQARGAGRLNYIVAGRLAYYPWDEIGKKLYIEPYALFDNQREQKIEFVGDASAQLYTVGLAFEGEYGNFECGFDTAFNLGHQCVYGWDRNIITRELRNGVAYWINDKVTAIANDPTTGDIAGKRAIYIPGSANQNTIDTAPEDQIYNGQQIDSSNLRNAADRFSNPYKVEYRGKMFVFDAAYWFMRPLIKWAWAAGMATGDVPPNRDFEEINESSRNHTYKGFIGLQEIYAGTRVRSAFLLSGAGRVPRVISFPAPNFPGDRNASVVTRFTNIIFCGTALWTDFTVCGRNFKVNPNVLAYWQDHATRVYDIDLMGNGFTTRCARKYFGIEANAFLEAMLLPDLKLFAVFAAFIPGTHFVDIFGKPLNAEQERVLNRFNRTGLVPQQKVPLLGTDPAFYLNLGFEYKF